MAEVVRDELIARLRTMHNDICIVGDFMLARLVGFHEDDRDYYYTIRTMNGGRYSRFENNQCCFSAVGAIVSLKELLPSPRYESLDRVFALNGSLPTDEFLITHDDQPLDDNDGCPEV